MAATTRRTASPTKTELWEHVCEQTEELRQQAKDGRQLTREVMEVVKQNTVAMTQVQSAIEALSKQLSAQQDNIETLVNQVTKAMVASASGVPMRVFVIVVAVMAILLFAVAGVKLAGLSELLLGS